MSQQEYHQWQLEQQEMEQDPEYINWLITLALHQEGELDYDTRT